MFRIALTYTCLVSVALLGACKPDYPACDNDDHCREGEFCVNKKCQQCRQSKDCSDGEQCRNGACEKIAGYCEKGSDCPNGGACKNNRCVPCDNHTDCGEGGTCKNGRCLKPGQCTSDEDCPENHECQNGSCVAPPTAGAAGPCQPEPIYFDFNEFVLTSEATAKLQAAAKCIQSTSGRKMRVEGHCDPRGTEEYNLALGDRRARSVQRYLTRLGVGSGQLRPVSKGKLEATGSSASSWARDRKVLFIWE